MGGGGRKFFNGRRLGAYAAAESQWQEEGRLNNWARDGRSDNYLVNCSQPQALHDGSEWHCQLNDMPVSIEIDLGLGVGIVQLTKVIAHRREPQRLGEPVAMLHESFTHESPELLTLTVKQAELN